MDKLFILFIHYISIPIHEKKKFSIIIVHVLKRIINIHSLIHSSFFPTLLVRFGSDHRPEYTDRAIEVGGTREGQSFVLKV